MPKIGIVLSGCGVMDGSEIHEAVLTLLAVSQQGSEPVFMAPDIDQTDVINHLSGEPVKEKRNVLVESARIARGKIRDIKTVKAGEIDALIFPGGYGAAKNLSNFASKGAECEVNPEAARLAREMHKAGKPVGAICIAPAVMAKIFQGNSVSLTIGTDRGTAAAIRKMGQKHVDCSVREVCVDEANGVVSTPAYMLAENAAEAFEGIRKLVAEVIRRTQGRTDGANRGAPSLPNAGRP